MAPLDGFQQRIFKFIASTMGCLSDADMAKYHEEYITIKEIIEKINLSLDSAISFNEIENNWLLTKKKDIQNIISESNLSHDAWNVKIKLNDKRIFDATNEDVIVKDADKNKKKNIAKSPSLENIYEQLKEVLNNEMDIDNCGIPEGFSKPGSFLDDPMASICSRIGINQKLIGSDKLIRHKLFHELLCFIDHNILSTTFNSKVASVICNNLKNFTFNQDEYVELTDLIKTEDMTFDEYISDVKLTLQECHDLSMILDAYFNPKPLTFNSNSANKSNFAENIKGARAYAKCTLM